ncbi:hypothetical protein VB002_08290 [Campylobacter concisus]
MVEIRSNVGIKDHTLLYTNDGDDSVKIYWCDDRKCCHSYRFR